MKHSFKPAAPFIITALIAGAFAFHASAFIATPSITYPEAFSNPRTLVGYFDNIFVGKVMRETDSFRVGAYYEVRYSVHVLLNIKGNLNGEITINSTASGADIGSSYLFKTEYSPQSNWYITGGFPIVRTLITNDAHMEDADIIALAERDNEVRAIRQTYPVEIVSSPDLEAGRAYNAYATRCLDANGELIDDTVQIANEKKGLPKAECVTSLSSVGAEPNAPPNTTQALILAFAALVIIGTGLTIGYVIRLATRRAVYEK